MKRLIDFPAVQKFELAAVLNANLRSPAGAERSGEFTLLSEALFGRQPCSLEPNLPPNYRWEGDGIYFVGDGEESREDEAAFDEYEADCDVYYRTYPGLSRMSDSNLQEIFLSFDWDISDASGRVLNCALPLAPLLLASIRGELSVPAPGNVIVDVAAWSASLEQEAAAFRGSTRR